MCCTILRFPKELIIFVIKNEIELILYRRTATNLILCHHKRKYVISRDCQPLADQGDGHQNSKVLKKPYRISKNQYKNLRKIKLTAVH